MKILYNLKLASAEKHKNYRVVSKIPKMDENNQYGQAMTKPLLTGCIKEKNSIRNWCQFNLIIEKISSKDKIGHLFIIGIELDLKRWEKKSLYLPVFDKNKRLDFSERSVFQLLETMIKNNKGSLNSCKLNRKTHSTISKKIFVPLYDKHIRLLVRAG